MSDCDVDISNTRERIELKKKFIPKKIFTAFKQIVKKRSNLSEMTDTEYSKHRPTAWFQIS